VYQTTQAILAGVERVGPRTVRARIAEFRYIRVL